MLPPAGVQATALESSVVPRTHGGSVPLGAGSSNVRDDPRSTIPPGRDKGFRQLSDEEYKEKRLKGLCFKCDERYAPEHVCKNKHFRFLIIEDEPNIVQDGEWQDALEDLGGTMQQLQLDFRSMAGQITIRSLRLWGIVAG